jgi:hypothetical protein
LVEVLDRGRAEGGYRRALQLTAKFLEARSASAHVPAVHVANTYDQAGDPTKALDWLERACTERDPNMAMLAVIPFSEELRHTPRFQELLRKMNLAG